MPLSAAIWSVNTQEIQFQSLRTRLENLSAALESANTHIPENGTALKGIFLAPEYYFAHPLMPGHNNHESGDQRHMVQSHKRWLEHEFTTLSKRYPTLLIIPGTVAWSKALYRYIEYGNRYDYAKSKFERGLIHTNKNRVVQSYLQRKNELQEKLERRKNEAISAAEIYDDPGFSSHTITAPTGVAKKTQLENSQTRIARNTAYFYLGGKQVFRYHKIKDMDEVLNYGTNHECYNVHLFKRSALSIANIHALIFGIEICSDHNLLKEGYNSTPIAIHILLSAYIEPAFQFVKGNIFLHASSNKSLSGAWKEGNPIPSHGTIDDLSFYKFEVD